MYKYFLTNLNFVPLFYISLFYISSSERSLLTHPPISSPGFLTSGHRFFAFWGAPISLTFSSIHSLVFLGVQQRALMVFHRLVSSPGSWSSAVSTAFLFVLLSLAFVSGFQTSYILIPNEREHTKAVA